MNVLFVGHDASRTGAPKSLLRFARWFVENEHGSGQFWLGRSGPLSSQYVDIAPVQIVEETLFDWSRASYVRRAWRKVLSARKRRELSRVCDAFNPDVVYVNSSAVAEFLDELPIGGRPVVLRVPELDTWIRHRIGLSRFDRLKDMASRFIAVSQAVQRNLIESYGVSEGLIDVISGFLPVEACQPVMAPQERNELRRELGIPADAFVVGGVGTLDWRKGADLFVQIAGEVRRRLPTRPLVFAWMGGGEAGWAPRELSHDVRQFDMADTVRFLGARSDALRVMESFDALAMTSREDPYPLVVLEAASRGKPIVCFADSGGAPEFVGKQCGFVVPYLDVLAFAERVMELIESPSLRESLGASAQSKAIDEHTVEVLGPKVMKVLEKARKSAS